MSKNSTLISRENCRFFGVKNSLKCCGFGLFSCWQLWFHEKNYQKKIVVKNSWKCWGFVKIEFLDKNLTFITDNFITFLLPWVICTTFLKASIVSQVELSPRLVCCVYKSVMVEKNNCAIMSKGFMRPMARTRAAVI